MSQVFYSSDQHIGHGKIAAIRGEQFGWRVRAVEAMIQYHDAIMANNWDCTVTKDDTVWVVGDISSGANAAQMRALEWFAARPGRKVLVAGNHDGVHPSNRDFMKFWNDYAAVFEAVVPFARRKISGINVVLSHFPYDGDHTAVDRMSQWRLRDEGLPIIHGHTHSMSRGDAKRIHVGVDAWNMTPVPQSEIERIIAGG